MQFQIYLSSVVFVVCRYMKSQVPLAAQFWNRTVIVYGDTHKWGPKIHGVIQYRWARWSVAESGIGDVPAISIKL